MRSLSRPGPRRICAGDLTERIVIETETRTADGYAGATRAWTATATVYAKAEPLVVGEREAAGALRNVTEYRFTVYASVAIGESDRIVWNGRTFAVRGIRTEARTSQWKEIIAESGLGD
jgi:SPP1 family predicted phage head-tail adaptor